MTTLARTHVAARRNVPPFDLILLVATMLVSVLGVVMVYTATRGSLLAQGDDPKTFLKKQGLFVVLGCITMVVVAVFDYRRLEPLATISYWLIVLALLGVYAVGSSAQDESGSPSGKVSGPGILFGAAAAGPETPIARRAAASICIWPCTASR